MGVIERRNCGKSVGLCSLILILSSVTALSHKLGQVEQLPKIIESTSNVRLPPSSSSSSSSSTSHSQHKGAITAITRRVSQQQHRNHPPNQSPNQNLETTTTTGRENSFNFGAKLNVNRGPSLFLHVPHANGKNLNQNPNTPPNSTMTRNYMREREGPDRNHNHNNHPPHHNNHHHDQEEQQHDHHEDGGITGEEGPPSREDEEGDDETSERIDVMTTIMREPNPNPNPKSPRFPTPVQIRHEDDEREDEEPGRGSKKKGSGASSVSASTSASTTTTKTSSSSSSSSSIFSRHGHGSQRKHGNVSSSMDTHSPSSSYKPSRNSNSNSNSHHTSNSHSNSGPGSNMGDHSTHHRSTHNTQSTQGSGNDYRSNNLMGGFLKREVWTIPLLSIAAVNIFLITLFEIYVLCKARGPSRRHLFLGQMLLFGLFLCSSLALVFAITPSSVGCFLGRLGLGIAYTLIFSVLMVKCIFLLSLDGGIYLPASYQACLLLFSVLVQVAIDTQWVIVYPPHLQENHVGGPLWSQCGTSYTQLLLTLSYNVFLIAVVGVLSFKTRGIRENYRESTYIGISILVTVPIWVSWTIAGWILQGRHQDACVAFGLLAQSLATFLIMFMPKGRQLAAMGKEGMYLEDQEDQCSGYSPSFFHFKPSKSYKTALIGDALSNGHFYRFCNDYNTQFYHPPSNTDGNVYTTLEPTISTINPNVFFHRSDFHPGMIY